MKEKEKWSIVLIHRLSQLMLGITVIGIVLNLVLLVVVNFSFLPSGLDLNVSLPAVIELEELGVYHSNKGPIDVIAKEMDGSIQILNAPKATVNIMSGFLMLVLILAFFSVRWFERMMKNVRHWKFFDPVNGKYLKKISKSLLGLWALVEFGYLFVFSFIMGRFEFDGLTVKYGFEVSFELLAVALFVWVLSQIFEEGAAMKEEQNLTV